MHRAQDGADMGSSIFLGGMAGHVIGRYGEDGPVAPR